MVYLPSEYRKIPSLDLLSWVFDNNDVDPEKDILIDAADPEHRFNTHRATSLIRKLIAGFKAAGLKHGDIVCMHAFNSILYPILYFSIIGAGGIFVGSNPAYKTLELRHLISITEPKFCIIEDGLLQDALPVTATCVSLTRTFILGTDIEELDLHDCRSWSELLQHGEQDWLRINNTETAKSTIAVLQSTSGTTGIPKVAASSHYALVASGIAMRETAPRPYEVTRLISLPLFHSFGASFVQIAAFRYGERTYIMRRFKVEEFASALQRFKTTEIGVVPAMLACILDNGISSLALKSLRRVWCAGMSLSLPTRKAMYMRLHEDAAISQVWGMTEFGRIASSDWGEKFDDGSVGRLLPNTELRVVDAQGTEVHDEGQSGELQIRGPSVMSHYSKCPAETAEAFSDGWLKTGDFGYVKADKIYISGRIKELIKVRGWQVSPTEIENVLLTHPSIVDAAVIGVKLHGKPLNDELPRAYIVTSGERSRNIDELEVKQYIKDRLSSFKALDGGVEFVDSIPRNHNGKILRQMLRERAIVETRR